MLWATKITFHVKSFYATHAHVTHVQCFFSVFPPLSLLETHFSSFFLVFSCIKYLILPRVRGTYPLSHIYKNNFRKQAHVTSTYSTHLFFPPSRSYKRIFQAFFLFFRAIEYLTLPRIRGNFPLSHNWKKQLQEASACNLHAFFFTFFTFFCTVF